MFYRAQKTKTDDLRIGCSRDFIFKRHAFTIFFNHFLCFSSRRNKYYELWEEVAKMTELMTYWIRDYELLDFIGDFMCRNGNI